MLTLRTSILQALYPNKVLTTDEITKLIKSNANVTNTTLYRLKKKLLLNQGNEAWLWKLTASGRTEAKQDRALFLALIED